MPKRAPLLRGTTLTRKQKAFADELINNPKQSATQAALKTYGGRKGDSPTYQTAQQLATDNLAKPHIQLYLQEHVDRAKNRMVELINSDKEDIALRASDSILDRALGKATSKIESTSVNLNLNAEADSQLSDSFLAFLRAQTTQTRP